MIYEFHIYYIFVTFIYILYLLSLIRINWRPNNEKISENDGQIDAENSIRA